MWERSQRQNPITLRYRYYLDHRPILPQDATLSFLRPVHHPNWMHYFLLSDGKELKKLYLNNLPAKDREALREFYIGYTRFLNNAKKFALIPAFFISAFLFRLGHNSVLFKYKIMYPIVFFSSLMFSRICINGLYRSHYNDNMSYYYYKYKHLAVNDLLKVNDPSRKYFKIDTSVYYRETPQDILHHSHGDEGHGEGHHDTSTYYGPYPVNILLIII